MSATTLNRHAAKVLKAALACVDRKTGFSFLFNRSDVNTMVLDVKKFFRLENAVAEYREAKKKRRKA